MKIGTNSKNAYCFYCTSFKEKTYASYYNKSTALRINDIDKQHVILIKFLLKNGSNNLNINSNNNATAMSALF